MHDFTSTPILHDIIISIECFYIALLLNVVVEIAIYTRLYSASQLQLSPGMILLSAMLFLI